jgi:hypothetical protein
MTPAGPDGRPVPASAASATAPERLDHDLEVVERPPHGPGVVIVGDGDNVIEKHLVYLPRQSCRAGVAQPVSDRIGHRRQSDEMPGPQG